MELDLENNVASASLNEPKRKKITHIWWTTVFCIFKAYPLVFGIVDIFFNIELYVVYICYFMGLSIDYYLTTRITCRILAEIRYHSYIVDGKQYYLYEYGSSADKNKCEVALFWILELASVIYYLGLSIGYLFSPFSYARLPLTIIGFVIYTSEFIRFCLCVAYRNKKTRQQHHSSSPEEQLQTNQNSEEYVNYNAENQYNYQTAANDDLYRWD